MRIAIGADHAGYNLKAPLSELLQTLGHEVVDIGAHSLDQNDDYPDLAEAVAKLVARDSAQRGIILCGSGVGASVVANKIQGVRAAICHDMYSAQQGVEHDDMNVLCLGARIVKYDLARKLVTTFLSASFTCEERHLRRLGKILRLESESFEPQID